MATADIKRAFRGVDTGQVDEVIRSIIHSLSSAELALADRSNNLVSVAELLEV